MGKWCTEVDFEKPAAAKKYERSPSIYHLQGSNYFLSTSILFILSFFLLGLFHLFPLLVRTSSHFLLQCLYLPSVINLQKIDFFFSIL